MTDYKIRIWRSAYDILKAASEAAGMSMTEMASRAIIISIASLGGTSLAGLFEGAMPLIRRIEKVEAEIDQLKRSLIDLNSKLESLIKRVDEIDKSLRLRT